MNISAVIFDMDGLMFDTERIAIRTWERAAKEFGFTIDEALIIKTIGRNLLDTKKIFLTSLGNSFPFDDIQQLQVKYAQEEVRKNGVPIKEGLHELIHSCKEHGISMAVATSTERKRAEELISQSNTWKYFDVIVCGDEVSNGKPEPDIFLTTAEKLGIQPNKCVVLEDSESGIVAACRAGMIPIFVPDLKKPSDEVNLCAYKICNTLREVSKIIEKC